MNEGVGERVGDRKSKNELWVREKEKKIRRGDEESRVEKMRGDERR